MLNVRVLVLLASLAQPVVALPKILCLHGGGGNNQSFSSQQGSAHLVQAMSSKYEFVFVTSPVENGVWVIDPPGGKGTPSTDPNIAASSVEMLNNILATQGPFFGLMGYSQGSMFVTYYLSQVPANTFQIAIMFCGYLPDTHLGMLDSINTNSPFSIRALVFMGANDFIITNAMTTAQAEKFTNKVVLNSIAAGHNLPLSSDPTFSQVVAFMNEGMRTGTPTPQGATWTPTSAELTHNEDGEGSSTADNTYSSAPSTGPTFMLLAPCLLLGELWMQAWSSSQQSMQSNSCTASHIS